MSRGPYKQYEYDPGICMPKSTCYKRKRNIEEVEENLGVCQSGENFLHVNDEENEVLYKLKSWQSPKLLIPSWQFILIILKMFPGNFWIMTFIIIYIAGVEW